MDECHLEHSGVVLGCLLKSREDSSAFLQPADQPLDDVPAAVGVAVEVDSARLAILVALAGNHRLDAHVEKKGIDPVGPIALVASDSYWPVDRLAVATGNSDFLQESFQSGRLVILTCCQVEVQRVTVGIAEKVDFRRKTAPAAAESVIGWLVGIPFFPPPAEQRAARTTLPSMHQSSESMSPASRWAACKARRILAKMPLAFQPSNRRQTVCQGPNSSGKSRQGEPVRSIQKMPSTTMRRSRAGRPVALGFGKKSWMQLQASSESKSRAIGLPSLAMRRNRSGPHYEKLGSLGKDRF